MPVPDDYLQVVRLLERGTQSSSLRWGESGREGEYVTKLPDYSITMSINRFTELFNAGLDVKSPITFQVLLPEGLEIATFEVKPDEEAYSTMRLLYDTAGRDAVK